MIDLTPAGIAREITNAENYVKSRLQGYERAVRRYHGLAFKGAGFEVEADTPENMYFEWISHVAPQLAGGVPRTRVSSWRAAPMHRAVAKAQQHGLNGWARRSRFDRFLLRSAVDQLFRYSACVVAPAPMPNNRHLEDGFFWPTVTRLGMKQYGWDPVATDPEDRRFQYHKWWIDKEDLIKHAQSHPKEGWDVAAIRSLPTADEVEGTGRDPRYGMGLDRGELLLANIHIPEAQVDDYPRDKGYNGRIVTHCWGAGEGSLAEVKIRQDRPFYGPRSGPYMMGGTLPVPDETMPLSPLVANEGLINDLNRHARASSESARRYKRLVLVSQENRRLAAQIKSNPHDFVFPVKGLQKDQVIPIEIGGITDQMIQYLAIARDRLERNIGLSDVMKGNISGDATATEVGIAAQGSEVRLSLIIDQFQVYVRDVLSTVSWYLYHDDRVTFGLGEDAAAELGMEDPIFMGGRFDEGSGMTWDDLELQIETYTMQRLTQSAMNQQAMTAFEIVSGLSPLVASMPGVDWDTFFDRMGEALRIPWLPDIFDPAAMQEAAQQQQQMAAGPQEGRQIHRPAMFKGWGQPVLGRQAGATGGLGGPDGTGRSEPKLGPRGGRSKMGSGAKAAAGTLKKGGGKAA